MTQNFDATKAASDLKQMLNMSVVKPHDDSTQNNNTTNSVESSQSRGYSSNKSDSSTVDSCSSITSPTDQRLKSKAASMNGDKSQKQKHKSDKQSGKGSEKSNSKIKKVKEQRHFEQGGSSKAQSNKKFPNPQNSNSSAGKNTPGISIMKREGSNQSPDMQNRMNHKTSPNYENSSPNVSKNLWDNLSREMQVKLDQNKIFFLKKKNMRFPNAKYFCRLCEYHMDTIEICEKHVQDGRHTHRREVNDMDSTLRILPPPTSNHLEAITTAVETLYQKRGLQKRDKYIRNAIVERLEGIIQAQIPDVRLHMYGTSLTCMGLKTADININLYSTVKDKKLTTLLSETYNLLKDQTDTGFSNVHSDFSATVPALLLTDDETDYKLTITIHFYSALCTSELLSIYSDFDERAVKLAVALRYWAHICGVDRHHVGFIPPVALNIMVVFFLQTIKPQLLPIVNPPGVCGEDTGDFSKDKPVFQLKRNRTMKVRSDLNNDMSIGELWVQLLRFYSIDLDIPNTVISIRSARPVARTSKPWNSRKLAVEDPFMLKKNLTRMVSHSYEFWQYSIRKVYHYFGLPRGPDGKSYLANYEFPDRDELPPEKPLEKNNAIADCEKSDDHQHTNSTVKAGELNSSISTHNSSHTTSDPKCSDKIEESEVTADLNTKSPSDDINLNTSRTLAANALVSSSSTSATHHHDPSSDKLSLSPESEHLNNQVQTNSSIISSFALDIVNSVVQKALDLVLHDKSTTLSENTDSGPCPNRKSNEIDNLLPGKEDVPQSTKSVDQASLPAEEENNSYKQEETSSEESTDAKNDKYSFQALIASKQCSYEFAKEHFASKREPTLICTSCEKEGHHKNECPDDELPEILPIPGFTKHHHKVLEETLKKIPSEVGLSDLSLHQRQMVLRILEEFIQVGFPGARLQLFGSSCNGFGFDRSDMDICMTFIKKKPHIEKAMCVERLANILKLHQDLKNVQSIPTAKVPIVKFTIKENDLDGDISLYNTLAQENTHLLSNYSKIDPRVQVLGYTIKLFAQVCDIGDASRGSLSSYAYILMMLYYLQQVNPPVIPVLQELYQEQEKPKKMIEGCDAWFMGDLNRLDKLWPEKGKNKMSAAELWLGFLRFYVEEFNYRELVISIRQKEPLSRFEKLWNGFCLAIEDPFDLNHNLGSGLSRTMNSFILKTFINGRMLYGSPIDDNMELFNKYQSPSDYFFDTELLSEARPPNSRGCRHCGKIGHMMRHCPINKKDNEDQLKQQQQKQQQRHPQDQQRTLQEQQRRHAEQQRQQQNLKDQQQNLHPPVLEQAHSSQHQQDVRKKQIGQGKHTPKQQQQQYEQPKQARQNRQLPQQQQNRMPQQQQNRMPQQQQNKMPRQQQQYPNKTQSFQQQKQHEAQQQQKQLERDWLNDRKDNELGQIRWSSGQGPNFNSPQVNFNNNPSHRPPPVQPGMNQRHPIPNLMSLGGYPTRYPPSLMPPTQRPRGAANIQGPFFRGPPPQGSGSPFLYNFNFNNMNTSANSNNNNNNTAIDASGHRLAMMPPQSFANMSVPESQHSRANLFSPHHAPPSNAQRLNPVVQNLFASTQGKVLDAREMHPHLPKRN